MEPEPVVPKLPEHLRWGVAKTSDFVPVDEQPPSWWGDEPGWWRALEAKRRWQRAVLAWGGEHGLDRVALMRHGLWPTRPPSHAYPAPERPSPPRSRG